METKDTHAAVPKLVYMRRATFLPPFMRRTLNMRCRLPPLVPIMSSLLALLCFLRAMILYSGTSESEAAEASSCHGQGEVACKGVHL